MPGLFAKAEGVSATGQQWFRTLTAAALTLLIVAAVGGTISHSWAGWVSAAAFGLGTFTTAAWIFHQSENHWYDGRAAAESIKSLTFKYAVGGQPYGIENPKAHDDYVEAVAGTVHELQRLDSPVTASDEFVDRSALDRLRAESLDDRRAAYREQRVDDQRKWYSRHAREYRKAGRRLQVAVVALDIAGIGGAALKGADVVHISLLSLFATMAAAATAWLNAADYLRSARAYDFAAFELDAVLERLNKAATEAEWATVVADAEQAMSREHIMWQARRRERR